MRTVKVPLGDRSYSIKIGNGLLSRLGSECRRLKLGTRCAVVTDRKVGPIYGKAALNSLREAGFEPVEIRVPAGETAKSLDSIHSCYDKLARQKLTPRLLNRQLKLQLGHRPLLQQVKVRYEEREQR